MPGGVRHRRVARCDATVRRRLTTTGTCLQSINRLAVNRHTLTRMLRQRGHVGYEACFMLSIPRRMKTRMRT